MFYEKTPDGYTLNHSISYFSKRYNQNVSLDAGYKSDGATGAFDIFSEAWWFHDKLCDHGRWDGGVKVTNWQASWVLADVLWSEGRHFRAAGWWFATFIFGGGKARKNGWFKLKEA